MGWLVLTGIVSMAGGLLWLQGRRRPSGREGKRRRLKCKRDERRKAGRRWTLGFGDHPDRWDD